MILRILGGFVLAVVAVGLMFIVVSKHYEERGRKRWDRQKTEELAALRPPPKPPHCPELPSLSALRRSDGQIDEVRIFRFNDTLYYVPRAWLTLNTPTYGAVGGIDRTNIGIFDPDLHAIECPGVIHQITDGGMYMPRYAGIGFSPQSSINGADKALGNVSWIFAHKLRGNREIKDAQYQNDGLIGSMDHLTLDAYVKVAPDVGLRLAWHPTNMTRYQWSSQYKKGTSASLVHGVPLTEEFATLVSKVRALHVWLATPPNRRPPNFQTAR